MRVRSLLIVSGLGASFCCFPLNSSAAGKSGGAANAIRGTGHGGTGSTIQTSKPENASEHNNRGVEFGSKGMWRQSIQEHEQALEADPWNQTFRTNLSTACLRFGQELVAKKDYQGAISTLRLAVYADPGNRLADDYLSAALKAAGKDPDDFKVRQGEAQRMESEGNYVEAIAEYKHCIRINDSGIAHYELGSVLLKQGDVVPFRRVEGYKELRTALTKNWQASEKQDLARCHAMLANILWEMANIASERGDSDRALKRLMNAGIEYRRAVTINPLNSDAIQGLVEVSRQAVAINPCFNNHLMLAGAYQLQLNFEQANREYQLLQEISAQSKTLDYSGSMARAWRSFNLAVVSSDQSPQPLFAATMKSIETQLHASPNDAALFYTYGRGKEQMGDKEAAIRAYEAAINLNPNVHPQLVLRLSALGGHVPTAPNPLSQAPLTKNEAGTNDYNQAQLLIASGNFDQAVTTITAFIDTHPANARAWSLLGSAHEKRGELEAAAADYRQASALGEKSASVALDRVNSLRVKPLLAEADKKMQANDPAAATVQLRDAIYITPKDLKLHHKLLGVLQQIGNSEEIEREQKRIGEVESSN